MDKKTGVLIIAILIFVGLVYFSKLFAPCSFYKVAIPINPKDSETTVAAKIIQKYLDDHQKRKVCISGWINNYQISQIEVSNTNQNGEGSIIPIVYFSVKPVFKSGNSYWIKQINKPVSLVIVKNQKTYELTKIITP